MLDARDAAVLVAGWEAWEQSLGAGLAAARAEFAAEVDSRRASDFEDSGKLEELDAAGLRAARLAADVPMAVPGLRPDAAAASALAAQLDAAEVAVDGLLAASTSGSRADVSRALWLTERLRAVGLRELAEMEVQGTHTVAGGPRCTTRSWLVNELSLSTDVAGSIVRLATELRDLPVLARAVQSGEVTAEHTRAICDGVRGLDLATVQQSQASLLVLSEGLSPARIRQGLKELAFAIDDKLAAEAHRQARERAGFTISPVGERYSDSLSSASSTITSTTTAAATSSTTTASGG